MFLCTPYLNGVLFSRLVNTAQMAITSDRTFHGIHRFDSTNKTSITEERTPPITRIAPQLHGNVKNTFVMCRVGY